MEKIKCIGMQVNNQDAKFEKVNFERRALKDDDVLIEIKYCGICHSDLHKAKNEWANSMYPMIPGHEIAGVVVDIGKNVTKFKVGDHVGVGCMVNSCQTCSECKSGYEQMCNKCVMTYNSIDSFNDNQVTMGGYSNFIVCNQNFVIKVPKDVDLAKVAPLLCAGITTYSPIVFSQVKPGDNVAIAGFGGLGLMAAKYALKFGANVYVIARNKNKEKFAKELGIKEVYTLQDNIQQKFDLIISTIPNNYDLNDFLKLLKIGGEIALLGLPPANDNWNLPPSNLIFNQHKKIYGSLIGGIKLTQEMLDFSIKNNIYPEIEIVEPKDINDVYDKLTSGKANFRYVIDMSKL